MKRKQRGLIGVSERDRGTSALIRDCIGLLSMLLDALEDLETLEKTELLARCPDFVKFIAQQNRVPDFLRGVRLKPSNSKLANLLRSQNPGGFRLKPTEL